MEIKKQYESGDIASEYRNESNVIENTDLGRKFLREKIEKLPRTYSILDIGFGNGIDLKSYKEMGFNNLYGIDPSTKLFEEVRELTQNSVELKEGTFEKIPYDDKSFDVVVSRCALHYTKDVSVAIKEVSRVLKDGGKFIATVSHPLADALEVKDKDGNVMVSLFKNKVNVVFPMHTLSDYFSETFFELFDLDEKYEYSGEERDNFSVTTPNVLCFSATKKVFKED